MESAVSLHVAAGIGEAAGKEGVKNSYLFAIFTGLKTVSVHVTGFFFRMQVLAGLLHVDYYAVVIVFLFITAYTAAHTQLFPILPSLCGPVPDFFKECPFFHGVLFSRLAREKKE